MPTLLLTALLAGANYQPLSEYSMGFSTAQNLADTPESNVIRMAGPAGTFTRLSLIMQVTWGTTATLTVQCKYSADGTNYSWMTRCDASDPHVCTIRQWTYAATDWVSPDNTPALDFETNYPYLVCQFDDTADGTGTIQVSASKGR